MKFLHSADWQLGAKMGQAEGRASDLRKMRYEAAEAVVQTATDEDVDFVVIAGDLFEDHNVSDRVVRRAVRILGKLDPIPVFVLPGNHDPLRSGGVWGRPSWKGAADHVNLLREEAPIEPVDGTLVYPCPLTKKKNPRDPTAWIPAREDEDADRIRVGVAHGSLTDAVEDPDFPISPERPEEAGLDYLALGDWHGTHRRERLAYPGTIEQSAFGESEPGNVLVVEIEEAGDVPRIEGRRVGQLHWVQQELETRDETDVEALEEELERLGSPGDLLIRLQIRLLEDADEQAAEAVHGLRDRLEEEAFYVEFHLNDSEFLQSGEVDLPAGLLCDADEVLQSILDGEIPEDPAREFADRNPEIVKEAQSHLRRLAREETQ